MADSQAANPPGLKDNSEFTKDFNRTPLLKRRIEECLGKLTCTILQQTHRANEAYTAQQPGLTGLFRDIAYYVRGLHTDLAEERNIDHGPSCKKRKINGARATPLGSWSDIKTLPTYDEPDVSFIIPARKKLRLQLCRDDRDDDKSIGGIRATDLKGTAVEFGIAWRDVAHMFCLPVPEKAKRTWNFAVIPHGNNGWKAPAEGAPEQLLWTLTELTDKERAKLDSEDEGEEPINTVRLINQQLAAYGKRIVMPADKEFASALPESHRKKEKAYHVKGWRGSKDGFLFFLSSGIVFGYKKPVLFFDFGDVLSVSYTSVQRITFNLVITTQDRQEFEFSMLDQEDFAGIDAYVKAHGLHDASLAKERAAKLYNVNKTRGAVAGEDGAAAEDGEAGEQAEEDDDDGMTELQRAEQQLQDEEDEMEEDFDPDAGESDTGSSDGEGEGEEEGGDEDGLDEQGAEGEEEEEYEGDEEEEEVDQGMNASNGHAVNSTQGKGPATSGFTVANHRSKFQAFVEPEEPEDGFL